MTRTCADALLYWEKEIRTTLANGGEVRPKILAVSSKGLMMYFDYRAKDDQQMDKMRETIVRTLLAMRLAGQFVSAAFLGEMWYSQRTTDNLNLALRASQDPNRKEGVFVRVWVADESLFRAWEIRRAGQTVELVDQGWMDKCESWIDAAFIPLPNVPPAVRLAALAFLDGLKQTNRRADA